MTTKRVIIKSNAASPFRVSVAGQDAGGAEFNNLIFDGNQQPLRLYLNGWTTQAVMLGSDTANVVGRVVEAGPATPAGTHPLFMTMWRSHANSDPDTYLLRTPQCDTLFNGTYYHFGRGAGAAYEDGALRIISFMHQSPSGDGFDEPTYINYAIFRNYQ